MIRLRAPVAGLLIALLLPWGAAAQTADLYTTIRRQEVRQAAVKKAEAAVRHFATLPGVSQWPVWVRDINHLLQRNAAETCSAQCETGDGIGPCINDENTIVRPALSPDACEELSASVHQLVVDEEFIRSVGRRMMATAAAQEGIVTERPEDPQNVAAHFAAIASIWTPGGLTTEEDMVDEETNIRIVPIETVLDPGEMAEVQSALAELESALQSLIIRWPSIEEDGETLDTFDDALTIDERMVAAVWRYQFGLRLIRGERAPFFPAPKPYAGESGDGERQYLFRDWPAVEAALLRLWAVLPQNPASYSPALAADDIAIIGFGALPLPSLPNVTVWARMDGDVTNNHPYADIGLRWILPTEPVLPSLLSDEYLSCIESCNGDSRCAATCSQSGVPFILGGEYPPEPVDDQQKPVDGAGLCSQPFAAQGYLCRPLESGSRSPCIEDVDPVDGTIILTSCTEECPNGDDSGEDCQRTLAGPDVCSMTWDDGTFDVRHQCSIELTCGSCDMGDSIPPKNSDGTIAVCPDPNTSAPASYGLLYSLAKAGQACGREPGYDVVPDDATDDERRSACCALENEAYRVMCFAMATDGVFAGLPTVDGIPINQDTCAEMMANYVCNDIKGYGKCPGSWEYTSATFAMLQGAFNLNPAGVPDSCPEAIDEDSASENVRLVTEALNNATNVCSPDRATTYRNSIGNNLCYTGQCIEQGMETHRIIGGRMPLTVGDPAHPLTVDAMRKIPGGLRFAPPPPSQGILPLYMPGVLVDAMETRICQTNALPPLQPPTRCGFDARRAIYGAGSLEDLGVSTAQQQADLASGFAVQGMAEALGIRTSADITAQYLAGAAAPLTGVVRSAAELLQQMTETEFPSEMCPLGPAS